MSDDSSRTAARLSGEDLSFWWTDSPMQPTTMAMLMVLDRVPEESRLRAAFDRAVAAVPKLAQRVVDAPLDLTLPHWESDPTFDLDYHLRRHKLAGAATLDEVFREIAPAYETPFDRSRPLWEARLYEGLAPRGRAAIFFKLHHALADGIGGNAIFAALTDFERSPRAQPPGATRQRPKGGWPSSPGLVEQLIDAVRDRAELDVQRARAIAASVADTVQHPEQLGRALQAVRSIVETVSFDSGSPLKSSSGRTRRLTGMDLPFAQVHALKKTLDGRMIDVILTIVAVALRKWHARHRLGRVHELMTLVPVNLRKREEWTVDVEVGNVATGILVRLPIHSKSPMTTYEEIRKRMDERRADPLSNAVPALSEALSVLPRPLLTWMSRASYGSVDFVVTNVPGILVPRYLAGAEILSAYPFAPVAAQSPGSVALYGYRDRLFIGLDTDELLMPDGELFQDMIRESFDELRAAAAKPRRRKPTRRAAAKPPARARAPKSKPRRKPATQR